MNEKIITAGLLEFGISMENLQTDNKNGVDLVIYNNRDPVNSVLVLTDLSLIDIVNILEGTANLYQFAQDYFLKK